MPTGFDARKGFRTALFACLKLILVAIAFLVLCMFAASIFEDAVGYHIGISGIMASSWRYIGPLLPIIPLAFIHGSLPMGSYPRLLVRLISAVNLEAVLLFIAGEMSYSVDDVSIGDAGTFSLDTIRLKIDTGTFSIVLSVIPVLSALDSVLEWLQHRPETGDEIE